MSEESRSTDQNPEIGAAAMSPGRVETLVDGIFAISMTLLVLNLDLPGVTTEKALVGALLDMWPHFQSYALSFYLLAVFWVIHHRLMRHVASVDEPFLWLNILAMIFIALIPFSTSIEGEYGNLQAAAVFFEGNLLAAGLAFSAEFAYASKNHRLLGPGIDQAVIDTGLRRSAVMPIVSMAAIVLSFFFAEYSTLAYLAIPVMLRHRSLKRTEA